MEVYELKGDLKRNKKFKNEKYLIVAFKTMAIIAGVAFGLFYVGAQLAESDSVVQFFTYVLNHLWIVIPLLIGVAVFISIRSFRKSQLKIIYRIQYDNQQGFILIEFELEDVEIPFENFNVKTQMYKTQNHRIYTVSIYDNEKCIGSFDTDQHLWMGRTKMIKAFVDFFKSQNKVEVLPTKIAPSNELHSND